MARAFLAAAAAAAAVATAAGRVHRNGDVGALRATPLPSSFCDPASKGEAGYYDIKSGSGTASYFYQFWESRNAPATDPLFLWLTGGPGCSSQLALYMENGPCWVNEGTGVIYQNPNAWNTNASGIWVDQPAGAGFSYGTTVDNEAGVSADLWEFLQAFYAAHPQYANNTFFITGESYGGHYVPATSFAVFTNNGNLQPGEVAVPLAGFAVGNGLTVPSIQYEYYPQLAYNWSITKLGHPVITLPTYKSMVAGWPSVSKLITKCQNDTAACANAQNTGNGVMVEPYEQTGLSPYDISQSCTYPPLCVDMTPVTNFLNDATTQSILGIDAANNDWQPCNFAVNGGFSSDWMKDFGTSSVLPLLNAGLRVLIYAGDLDFICNWLGNQAWTLELPWNGQAGFNAATFGPWTVGGSVAGNVRAYNNFAFATVANAGHMAPGDQPVNSHYMINQFFANQPIA